MTDISLPYKQIVEIIITVSVEWARNEPERPIYLSRAGMYEQFGHKLLRALEEAHLARQGKE